MRGAGGPRHRESRSAPSTLTHSFAVSRTDHTSQSRVLGKHTQPCMFELSLQSCPTFREPVDCSPPGSSVHGTLQARILEWAAISFSRGFSQPRDQTHISYPHWQMGSLPLVPPGNTPLQGQNSTQTNTPEALQSSGHWGFIGHTGC